MRTAKWMFYLLAAPALMAADCEGLAKMTVPFTSITTAKVEQRENSAPFCRVTGVIKPTDDSHIEFEVWMPVQGWNGKFQGVGNGGFAGSIGLRQLESAVRSGYAAAGTDTGHKAVGTDASWAYGHPEKVIDFGHRAIHEMTVKAKAIVQQYYGSAPKRSYFSSCSNGGRQALMEVQRYPEDYAGVIAGAPANYWTHLLSNGMANVRAMADGYIPMSKLRAIQDMSLAACDAMDGVKDGVIENPAMCRIDPVALTCSGAESDWCLTAAQVKALKQIYDGARDSKGKSVFPGYSPGGEAEQGGWGPWISGQELDKSLLYAFGVNYFRNIIYDPKWDYKTFDFDREMRTAVEKTAHILNATDPDLGKFAGRGGKLILYHGWCDAAIPAQNTINYYDSVVKKMGKKKAASFVRLYMLPGVQHCAGGAGPDNIGQGDVAKGDARTNVAAALERWVEQGTAPAEIIAVKRKGTETLRSRPVCPYPQTARYKGSGSTDDAANFVCEER